MSIENHQEINLSKIIQKILVLDLSNMDSIVIGEYTN